jgi:hypothetical protein
MGRLIFNQRVKNKSEQDYNYEMGIAQFSFFIPFVSTGFAAL